MVTIIFPGRHHLLTKFQYSYLRNILDSGIKGKKVDRIIFAVTSADHANTRRNPLPLYLRALAIEKFSRDLPCEVKIYPISDVKQTDKFAEYILHQIEYYGEEKLTPKNSVLACSTPSVIKMFKKLKFDNLPVELIDEKKSKYSTLRPYEVVELLVKAGKNWRTNLNWKELASEASQDVFLEYNLGDSIIELFNDSLINEDANLTDTRDYNSYAKGMDQNISFKFNDIKPFVVQGKIVDAGCGTGALIWQLSKYFEESDIIGIEATRNFYEYCKLQQYPNPFVYFYRRNIIDQNFKENTINTFIYSSAEKHPAFEPYNRIIFHASTETLLHYLQYPPSYIPDDHREDIIAIMKAQFTKNKDSLIKRCHELAVEWDGKKENNEIFRLEQTYRFKTIADRLGAVSF